MSDLEAKSSGVDAEPARPDATDTSDAFATLGDENRVAAIEAISRAEEPLPFSDLFDAAPADTTAGFAYHLRQLVGGYLEEVEEGYTLSAAGRRVARAIRAGAYTRSTDLERDQVDDPCPLCGADDLETWTTDGVAAVACTTCESPVLSLSCPPGVREDSAAAALRDVDRHHRHRLATMADGGCPDCGGGVVRGIEPLDRGDDVGEDGSDGAADATPHRAHLACPSCGWQFRCPVTVALLEHPGVVAFYHDHGRDLGDRPLWNVGEEWRERVLSTDPTCVRVATRLDDELLELLVGGDLTVVEARRFDLAA